MSENRKHDNLSLELLRSIDRFIDANFLPELSPPKFPMWKGAAFEDFSIEENESERFDEEERLDEEEEYTEEEGFPDEGSEDLFDARRIEMDNGAPVLSRPMQRPERHSSAYERQSIEDVMRHVELPFNARLLQLIDEKGYTDAEVYKRAHIDRKLFSKIRSSSDYIPRKRNVIALALALHLNIDEASDLLRRAGMALSHSSKSDLIAEYCIENGIYDINTVNDLLDEYGEPILG